MSPAEQIELKSAEEIDLMRASGSILREVRDHIGSVIKPGMTTLQLDRIAKRMIDDRGAVPAFLGYQGFPGTLCTSVNEEIVHGIPSERVLEEGDILSVDVGLIRHGFFADTAATFPVGGIDATSQKLLDVTRKSLDIAIEYIRPGKRIGDMGAAVQKYVESHGFSVVREYAGHGIGRKLHEDPRIPNYGKPGTGQRWKAGMVVAVEPMVNVGTQKTKVLGDKWTVISADKSRSAHFEHTIAIHENGPEILT